MSPLGPMDQGSPWAPTRSGGEISSALALLLPDPGPGPGPLASTYHLEGAVGPSCFLWLPVALELVGGRGKQGSVLFRVPAPSSTSGAGAVSIGVAGLPRTPCSGALGELGRPRATGDQAGSPQQGGRASLSPVHYHKGVCSPQTHSP